MELKVSNKREKTKLVLYVAVIGFITAFLSTPFILNAVYGIKPGDVGYKQYYADDGTPNTPYQDFIANGCMTKPIQEGDKTIVFDTSGLAELGMFWFDPNTCFDLAMTLADEYDITKVEKDINDHMIITLTKKQ